MSKVLFKEEQRFMQPLIWLILILSWLFLFLFFGYGVYRQILLGEPWGAKPMPDNALLGTFFASAATMAIITVLLHMSKLIFEVRDDGIRYSFPPFIRKMKKIGKEEIEHYEVRRFRPIAEYGGYGIRKALLSKRGTGDAFIVKGGYGLQLRLNNGKKVLFGTARKEAILHAVDKMMGKE